VSFYDDVLREIVAAVGAALFLGNLIALLRRRSDRRRASERAGARGRSRAQAGSKGATARNRDTLPEAPLTRTVLYLVIGFVVMIAGIAAMVAK
jgi:predicted permease